MRGVPYAGTTDAPAITHAAPRTSRGIVHVLAPARAGGLETVVMSLARGQHMAGHRVSIVALIEQSSETHPFVATARALGIPAETIAAAPRAYRAQRKALDALLRRLDPDVVHTHGYLADVLVASLAGVRCARVTTVHGFTGGSWRNRLYQQLQCLAFRRLDAVVVVSRPLVTQLAGPARGRMHLCVNALDNSAPPLDSHAARERLGLPLVSKEPVIGWVGRLSPEKGPDVLLRALANLTDLPLSVSFVGDGRELPALKALAEELGVAERVRWHGSVADAGKLLAAFDVVVSSSRTEGTPMVLLEAMAASRRIVATRVGGVPDVVSAEEALLVPSDDPAALADAIRETLADLPAADARAAAAHAKLLRGYSPERWLQEYEVIYDAARARRTRTT